MIFRNLCWVERDKVWIEIPIKTTNRTMFEFLLIQNKETEDAFKNMPHLKLFLSPDKVTELKHTSLTLFVEHSSITPEIFTSESLSLVQKLERAIVSIHVTDQYCYNNYEVCLKAQIAIDTSRGYQQVITDTMKLLMDLVKRISSQIEVPTVALKVVKAHRTK